MNRLQRSLEKSSERASSFAPICQSCEDAISGVRGTHHLCRTCFSREAEQYIPSLLTLNHTATFIHRENNVTKRLELLTEASQHHSHLRSSPFIEWKALGYSPHHMTSCIEGDLELLQTWHDQGLKKITAEMKKLLQLKYTNRKPYREYVAFDLETTGFHPGRGAEIIEIAAVRVIDGWPVAVFQTFVKPKKGIPKKITDLTGITSADVADAPLVQEALLQFYEFAGAHPLIAHNLPFDLAFLKHYTEGELKIKTEDTLSIAKRKLARAKQEYKINSFKLGDVASYFGHVIPQAHRAQDDALAVHAIYEAFRNDSVQ